VPKLHPNTTFLY